MSNCVKMRAKVRVGAIVPFMPDATGKPTSETLTLFGVAAGKYPEDGSDENNNFAKFSPSVCFTMNITNPALLGAFKVDDTFYVDFTPATK